MLPKASRKDKCLQPDVKLGIDANRNIYGQSHLKDSLGLLERDFGDFAKIDQDYLAGLHLTSLNQRMEYTLLKALL
jgi:hypothetical protein